jgi:hypothetical protein
LWMAPRDPPLFLSISNNAARRIKGRVLCLVHDHCRETHV